MQDFYALGRKILRRAFDLGILPFGFGKIIMDLLLAPPRKL